MGNSEQVIGNGEYKIRNGRKAPQISGGLGGSQRWGILSFMSLGGHVIPTVRSARR